MILKICYKIDITALMFILHTVARLYLNLWGAIDINAVFFCYFIGLRFQSDLIFIHRHVFFVHDIFPNSYLLFIALHFRS